MYKRSYRSGFSLIELLIVVAIIAALIGVAVPYFQNNLAEAQITKAKQDMDTLRNAINLYESRFKPLIGTDLKQILGQTMNEIPNDPWGNPYLLDANIGIIFTYGQDGVPSGTGADADQYFLYKPKLQIRKCEYEGSYGPPSTSNKMTLYFTKPYSKVAAGTDVTGDLVLRIGIGSGVDGVGTTSTLSTHYTAGKWTIDGADAQLTNDAANGLLRLKYTGDSGKQAITSTMAVDLAGAQANFKVQAAANSRLTTESATGKVSIPGLFEELKGIPAENKLGARVERKL